jgi:hypothetical protein
MCTLGRGGETPREKQPGPETLFGDPRLVPRPRVHVDEAARRTAEPLDAPAGVAVIAEEKRG